MRDTDILTDRNRDTHTHTDTVRHTMKDRQKHTGDTEIQRSTETHKQI